MDFSANKKSCGQNTYYNTYVNDLHKKYVDSIDTNMVNATIRAIAITQLWDKCTVVLLKYTAKTVIVVPS